MTGWVVTVIHYVVSKQEVGKINLDLLTRLPNQSNITIMSQNVVTWLKSDIEIFATIIAALIHDYEHTGTTNNFHIMTGWVVMFHIAQELQITFT
jgi:hypothetical protein